MNALDLFDEYVQDKRLQQVSPHTIRHYQDTVGLFLRWCKGQVGCDLFDIDGLQQWAKRFLHAQIERGLRPYTIHTYGRGIGNWFAWCIQVGYLEKPLRFRVPPAPQSHIIPLETEYLRNILLLLSEDKSLVGLRDYCIVRCFCETGMRLSEMAGVRRDDLDLSDGSIRVIGKGDKHRFCYISERTTGPLRAYLGMVDALETEHQVVWITTWRKGAGHPLGTNGIRNILSKVRKRVNYEGKLSPHVLRHTFAIMYLENGGDALSLQQAMGHSKIETTTNYVNYSKARLKKTIQRYNPGNSL